MRISYIEEEDSPGQFDLWQANCERSLRGKQGQAELRELHAALLALPEKRLVCGLLTNEEDGEVCAVGAYAKRKGLDLSKFDPEYDTGDVGVEAGMPPLVAWKVVEINDLEFHDRFTPEERYIGVLRWVESKLMPSPAIAGESGSPSGHPGPKE